MTKRTNLNKLVECAILLAAAAVLSFIKVVEMPLGGSVTAVSMLPIVLAGYRNGWKWGLLTGVTYSVFQIIMDIGKLMSWGLTPWSLSARWCLTICSRLPAGHRRHLQPEEIRHILCLRVYADPALSHAFSVRHSILRLVCGRGLLAAYMVDCI